MAKTTGFRIEFLGDDEISKKLKRLEGELEELSRERKELSKNFKKADLGTEEFEKLSGKIANNKIEAAELRKEQGRLKKAFSDGRKTIDAAAGSYEGLVQRNKVLRQEFKKFPADITKLTNSQKKLTQEFKDNTDALKKFDAEIGQNFRNVGNYKSALGGLKTVLGAAGIAGGLTLAVNAVKNLTSVFIDFEQQMARVKAISGATDEEFKLLEEDAKRLGESTQKTATEVAQLQEEYAKLGFTTDQIIDATEATLNLSIATGEDLAQSATIAGSTLRAFNLDASETGHLTDVMAKAFTSSSLDLSKFGNAMATVAPVANTFGFQVEETTALLAQLSDAGFDASSAGTATRNILLNMADSSGELAKALGKPVTDLPSLVDGLNKLNTEGIDLAETLQLTDKRSVAAFNRFLQTGDAALQLSEDLKKADGAAKAMADIVGDTLQGELARAGSAVEGLFISIGEKLGPVLRDIVAGFITFIGILREIPNFIKENKAEIIGLGIALAGLRSSQIAATAATIAQNVVSKASTIATTAQTIAQKGLNTAMKANPIGLIITSIGLLVTGFTVLFKKSETVRDGIKGLANVAKTVFDIIKETIGGFVGGFKKIIDGDFTGGLKDIGTAIVKTNPIGLAITEGKRLGQAFNKGMDDAAKDREKKRKEEQRKLVEEAKKAEKEREDKILAEQEKARREKELRDKANAKRKADEAKKSAEEQSKANEAAKKAFEKFFEPIDEIDLTPKIQEVITTFDTIEPEEQVGLLGKLFGLGEDREQELIAQLTDLAANISDQVNNIVFDNKQKRLRRETDAEVDALEAQREAALDNENLTEAQRLAIGKKFDQQRAALEKAAAERQRNLDATRAVIAAFLAAGRALATPQPPLFLIPNVQGAALALAQGLTQAAAIRAQKFEKGGMIKGRSHAQGGVPIEAEGGEFVVNKRATSRFRPLLERVNKFQTGGLVRSTPIASPRVPDSLVNQVIGGGQLNIDDLRDVISDEVIRSIEGLDIRVSIEDIENASKKARISQQSSGFTS